MSQSFSDFPELIAGFSTAADGTMTLNGGFENRRNYLAQRGLLAEQTVHAGLCHGTNVIVVSSKDAGNVLPHTDGLITNEAGLGLAMTAADCALLSAYDPVNKVIGIVHAGRRGLAAEIVTHFFDVWRQTFSTNIHDCIVHVSPSICSDHYTVSDADAAAFTRWSDVCRRDDDGVHLDIRAVVRQQVLACGVQEHHITFDRRCTFEDSLLFSYRRDHPATPQLQVGYLMRKGNEARR